MNILLINHYAGSQRYGMEYRPYYLAQEWVLAGHKVRVIGASVSHLRIRNPAFAGPIGAEVEGIVEYRWLRTPRYEGNGLGRVLNMLCFVVGLYTQARRVLQDFRPDAVIASSTYPLDNFPAYSIAKRYGAAFVYEVHDLWPLSPMELGGYSRLNPYIMAMQAAENYAYLRCDRVISLLPAAEGHMREHGLAEGKFHCVPNGVVAADWVDPLPLPAEVSAKIDSFRRGRFLVGYAGGHGLSNALNYFIEAARIAPEVAFLLVGNGPEKERLRGLAAGLDNVLFLDALPKPCVPALLQSLDAQYLGWTRSPLYRHGISPNKLFDYMMAEKPVVHAVDAGNDPCAEADCGISVEPENPVAIAAAVRRLAAMSPAEREAMGRRGREYVLANHDYRVLAQRFLDILKDAVERRRSAETRGHESKE